MDGSLQGQVLFAQNIIIPSKSATDPADHRPHLVSLRDTLILFKPISNVNPDLGVTVNINNKDNQQVFTGNMSPPDAMPRITEQAPDDIDEYEFIEPESYDYVFSDQQSLDLIDGGYLRDLLSTKSFVKIETADGQWIRNFYLPALASDHNDVLIVFDIQSSMSCLVSYDGKQMELTMGTKMAFTFVEGTWDTIYESFYTNSNAVQELIATKNYETVVQGYWELKKMEDDVDGNRISLLLEKGNLNIKTADGAWIKDFWLPKNNAANEGKIVTFTANAGYTSTIYYDYGSLRIGKGDNLVFLCKDGKWVEYSDTFFSKIKYGVGYWSLKVPLEAVVPEINFSFSHDNMNGVLNNVKIGAPNELLLHTIDIGMLVTPRDEFEFQKDSNYHAEYFQTVPISRLIVTEYESITFDKVVLPDGTVYTDASAVEGGVYEGDMRQNIGKELVSIGINHANYGIHSTTGPSEKSPYSCAQITAHNSRGKYRNGEQIHGLSGGGSIVTLLGSVGNEFSHELGHNYGLGHYPNGFSGSVHRSSEYLGSSWGWDSVKNVFVPNFEKAISGEFSCIDGTCQEPFLGHKFGYDSMAGGDPLYLATNSYTLYTPYVYERIQQFLETKAVFDPTSSTGMKMWNDDCNCMEEWDAQPTWTYQIEATPTQCSSLESMKEVLSQYTNILINFGNGYWTQDIYLPIDPTAYVGKVILISHQAGWGSNVHIGSETVRVSYGEQLILVGKENGWEQASSLPPGKLDIDQDIPRSPAVQGIPVTTLVGYYDPEAELESYIYPALHGAYGNTFNEDSVDDISSSGCSATISSLSKGDLKFALKGYRKHYGNMNKFHINVAESFEPKTISLHCNGELLAERDITPASKQLSFTVNGRPLEDLSKPPESCFWNDMTYRGGLVQEGGRLRNIESAFECQKKCQEHPDCEYFNYKHKRGLCVLKKEGVLEADCGRRCNGKIAGPKNCD